MIVLFRNTLVASVNSYYRPIIYLSIPLFLLLLLQCRSSQPENTLQTADAYKAIAVQKFGEAQAQNTQFRMNEDKSMVLCIKPAVAVPGRNQNSPSTLHYFVYNIKENSVVHEQKLESARVSWHSNTRLHIQITPGIVTDEEDMSKFNYLFDLNEMAKVPMEN